MGVLRKVHVPLAARIVIDDDEFPNMTDEEIGMEVAKRLYGGFATAVQMTCEDENWGADDYFVMRDENIDDPKWFPNHPMALICRPDGGTGEQYEILDALIEKWEEDRDNDDLKTMVIIMQQNIADQGQEVMDKIKGLLNLE